MTDIVLTLVPLQVLGIVGALDPHTHKVNQAKIQGEGQLERVGVRPQRQPDPTGLGGGAAVTLGKALQYSTVQLVAVSVAQLARADTVSSVI